jgi:endonuclease G
MPVPTEALKKKLARLTGSTSAYTLKYHHISTFHHAIRRVPVVSGINVHGRYRYSALGKDSGETSGSETTVLPTKRSLMTTGT